MNYFCVVRQKSLIFATIMKIRELVDALEEFAPLSLQDGFDNAGMQIGLADDAEAAGALLCLDVTEDVIDEAVEKGCNIVVSHHPLMFRPCKTITGANYVERCVIKAIRNGVSLYAAHTNLDNAYNGVNFKMAEKLGLKDVRVLEPKDSDGETGAGLVGVLPEAVEKEDFLATVKETFDVACLRYNSWTGEKVKTVALCGGAGGFLIPEAVKAGADCFITGEIGYHKFFGLENDILLMELGHFESEQYTVELIETILRKRFPELLLFRTELETNPINYL